MTLTDLRVRCETCHVFGWHPQCEWCDGEEMRPVTKEELWQVVVSLEGEPCPTCDGEGYVDNGGGITTDYSWCPRCHSRGRLPVAEERG